MFKSGAVVLLALLLSAAACSARLNATPKKVKILGPAPIGPRPEPSRVTRSPGSAPRPALGSVSAQANTDPRAMAIYNAIMEFRATYGLPKIPWCNDLNIVAATHVEDLTRNPPKPPCMCSSWSKSSKWRECCWDANTDGLCSTSKPRELTNYMGNGYELTSGGMTPEDTVDMWKRSPGTYEVLINKGGWATPWKAIGIATNDQWQSAWFGNDPCV